MSAPIGLAHPSRIHMFMAEPFFFFFPFPIQPNLVQNRPRIGLNNCFKKKKHKNISSKHTILITYFKEITLKSSLSLSLSLSPAV